LLSTAIVTGGLLVACSDDEGSTFEDKPLLPEASAPGPGFDAGGDGAGDAGPPRCDPAIPADFKPSWAPPATRPTPAACSAQELTEYYAACLEDTTKPADCAAFAAAHAACTRCIEQPSTLGGPVQWHTVGSQERLYFTINVAGCLALEQGKVGEDDCGGAYNAAVQCSRQSCEQCLATGGQFTQFSACQKNVQTGGLCKSYEDVQSVACSGIKDPDAGTLACFQAPGEGLDVFFPRLMNVFCGAP
jgi:hypothetical protein